MERIYLDYNASAPLLEPVKAAMIEAFDVFGNGSSVHSQGRKVHGRIETAREQVAKMVGAASGAIVMLFGYKVVSRVLLLVYDSLKCAVAQCLQ